MQPDDHEVKQALAIAALMPVKKEPDEKVEDEQEHPDLPEADAAVEAGWPDATAEAEWPDATAEAGWPGWHDAKDEEPWEEEPWEDPDPEWLKREQHDDGVWWETKEEVTDAAPEEHMDATNQTHHDDAYQAYHQGQAGQAQSAYVQDTATEQTQTSSSTVRIPWKPKEKGKGYGNYDRRKGYNKGKTKLAPWAFRERQRAAGKAGMKGKTDDWGGVYTASGYRDPSGQHWWFLGCGIQCSGLTLQ